VPNFTTNDSPSIYAALQTFYTFYIKITLFPFSDYDTLLTPSQLWQKRRERYFNHSTRKAKRESARLLDKAAGND
jgi:hypothetical protein